MNRHFLVVDDDEMQRLTVRRLLNRFGAESVMEATDGRAAIDLIHRYEMSFDAIITDFNMAGMNGIQLLKAIRTGAEGLKRNMQVIMLTAHSDDSLVAAALALDADGFVVKPVSRDGLLQRVLRALQKTMPIRELEVYRAAVLPGQIVADVPDDTLPPRLTRPAGAGSPESEIGSDGQKTPMPASPLAATAAAAPVATAAAAAQPQTTEPVGLLERARMVDLNLVKPNSVLAQDVYSTGKKTLLLSMETVLSATMLERLKDLRGLHSSVGRLYVVDPE